MISIKTYQKQDVWSLFCMILSIIMLIVLMMVSHSSRVVILLSCVVVSRNIATSLRTSFDTAFARVSVVNVVMMPFRRYFSNRIFSS